MERIYDMIIIGGGPAGLSAGIYGGRAKLDVLIIEKENKGGQISLTSEVVNYPGVFKATGEELTKEMAKQAVDFGAEIKMENVISPIRILNRFLKFIIRKTMNLWKL